MEGKRKRDSSSGSEAAKKKGREDEKGEDVTKPKPQRRRKEAQEKADDAQVELNASQAKLESSQLELKEAQKELKAAQQLWEEAAVVGNTAVTKVRKRAIEDARRAIEDARRAVEDARKLRDFWLNPRWAAEEAMDVDVGATKLVTILQGKRDTAWLSVESAPIYIRACYEKMAELLTNPESLRSIAKLTYVVKGTPGIGKTTMLQYLLWSCTRDDSPFTAVLFATDDGAFVVSKTGGLWTTNRFEGRMVRVREGGKVVGLVDVSPDGRVEMSGQFVININQQGPCTRYGLHRLVVAASVGAELGQLIDKDKDGRIPRIQWLPAWQPDHTRLWAKKVLMCCDEDLDSIESTCGLRVPRLVKVCNLSKTEFDDILARFLRRLSGINCADRQSSAKDAHTMLLTQPSKELCEVELDEEEHRPGDVIGFVSRRVAGEIAKLVSSGESIEQVVRIVPKVVGYVFEQLAITALLSRSGLGFAGDDSWHLKFSGEGPLLGAMKGMERGVLYYRQWGAHYLSIDCCGVPTQGDRFFLIQFSTGQRHRRVQKKHVDSISVPTNAKSVVVLYITPTSPSSIKLFSGTDPLTSGTWKRKPIVEKVVSAPSILDTFPLDVKRKFELGGHS